MLDNACGKPVSNRGKSGIDLILEGPFIPVNPNKKREYGKEILHDRNSILVRKLGQRKK